VDQAQVCSTPCRLIPRRWLTTGEQRFSKRTAKPPLLISPASCAQPPAGRRCIRIQHLLAHRQRKNAFQLSVSQRPPKRCPTLPKTGLATEAPSSQQPASENPIRAAADYASLIRMS
jgi:hypothetical protein